MDAEDELQYGRAVVDDKTPTPIGNHDDQDSVAHDCIGSLEGRPARALQS
jgi:hypothetical protein